MIQQIPDEEFNAFGFTMILCAKVTNVCGNIGS